VAEAGRLARVHRPEAAARCPTPAPTKSLHLRHEQGARWRPGPGHGPTGQDFRRGWWRRVGSAGNERRGGRDPRTRQSGHGNRSRAFCQAESVHVEKVQQTGARGASSG